MEQVLLTLLIANVLGFAVFGRFESETAWWRPTIKWGVIIVLTYWLFNSYGKSVTLIVLAILYAVSVVVHFTWCKVKGIHPINATPRKKYYELRGWMWRE